MKGTVIFAARYRPIPCGSPTVHELFKDDSRLRLARGDSGAKAEARDSEAESRHNPERGRQTSRSASRLDEFQTMKKEVRALKSLRSKGVSDSTVLRWDKIIAQSGLTPGTIQKELAKNASLSRLVEKTEARVEKARLALGTIDAKNEELRRKYSTSWDSITRYQLLREAGVDGSVLQRWERLVVGNGLDPEDLERELLELRNLNESKKGLEGELAELNAKVVATSERLKTTEGELARLESQRIELVRSVDDITQHFKASVRVTTDDATERLAGVEAKAGEELRRVSAEAQSDLRAELDAAASTVDGFKRKIEEAYESAFQTGQTIGKNEALKPLVRFVETTEGNPGEVIPLMSLLARSLARWAEGSDPVLAAKARDLEEYLNGKLRGV